ncbi:MAG: VOC family protein [Verrucomicrobiales bacterium]
MNIPPTYPPMSPYLTVKDAAKAIEFYTAAFGATELFRLSDPASGAIGHAEIMLNGCLLMLSEENPAWGNQSPLTLNGTPVKLCLVVEDTDAAVERASAAGAIVEMPPADMFYGFRSSAVRDPFGHQWMIQHEIEKVAPEEMQKRWAAMLESGAGCPGTES